MKGMCFHCSQHVEMADYNYRGSSTLRKCCGWKAASYVAASPHTNNLLLPLALAAHMSSAGPCLGLCWWVPALGTSARSAPAAVPGQLPVQPCAETCPEGVLLLIAFSD